MIWQIHSYRVFCHTFAIREEIMAHNIDTPKARAKLSPRREPYWVKVAGKGKHLGFRSTESGGFWIAKLRTPDGNRTTQSLGGADKLDYTAALQAALLWFESVTGPAPSEVKIKHVISAYLDYLHNNKAPGSYESARSRAGNHILPQLGEQRVANLTTDKYERWLDKLGERLAHGSNDPEVRRKARYNANSALKELKAALNRAHRSNRTLDADEWRYVKRLENGSTKGRDVFFSAAESQRLVNACEGSFRDLVIFGLLTGCRLGEAVQMRVRDFDADRGQWDMALGKTGPRTCVLTNAAIDLLGRLTAGREKADLVFLRENGEPWNKSNIRLRMNIAIKRAKLDPNASFYTLRHTYISSQLNAGVPTLAIAQNVGTGVAQIEKHYGKFISDDRRKWLESGQIKLEVPPKPPGQKVVNIR